MRILVTGSSGFIGSALVKRLKKIKKDVIGIDQKEADTTLVVSNILDKPPKFYKQFDIIYHLASLKDARESFEKKKEYRENIVNVTKYILKNFNGIEFIFTSTMAAYKPITPYGKYKLETENIIKLSDKRFKIYRLANVYGGKKSTSIIEKKNIKIYGDGEQLRDYIHVDDVVNILTKDVFDLGTGIPISLNDLFPNAEHIKAIKGDVKIPKIHTDFNIKNRLPKKLK